MAGGFSLVIPRRWLRQQLRVARGPEAEQRCYFFNSFFYKKLTEAGGCCRAVPALPCSVMLSCTLRACGGVQGPSQGNCRPMLGHACYACCGFVCLHPAQRPCPGSRTHPTPLLRPPSRPGGKLPEDVADFVRTKLRLGWREESADWQALRNHQKVKNWTRVSGGGAPWPSCDC